MREHGRPWAPKWGFSLGVKCTLIVLITYLVSLLNIVPTIMSFTSSHYDGSVEALVYNPGVRPILSAKAVHLSYMPRIAADARETPTATASPSPALSARLIPHDLGAAGSINIILKLVAKLTARTFVPSSHGAAHNGDIVWL